MNIWTYKPAHVHEIWVNMFHSSLSLQPLLEQNQIQNERNTADYKERFPAEKIQSRQSHHGQGPSTGSFDLVTELLNWLSMHAQSQCLKDHLL